MLVGFLVFKSTPCRSRNINMWPVFLILSYDNFMGWIALFILEPIKMRRTNITQTFLSQISFYSHILTYNDHKGRRGWLYKAPSRTRKTKKERAKVNKPILETRKSYIQHVHSITSSSKVLLKLCKHTVMPAQG